MGRGNPNTVFLSRWRTSSLTMHRTVAQSKNLPYKSSRLLPRINLRRAGNFLVVVRSPTILIVTPCEVAAPRTRHAKQTRIVTDSKLKRYRAVTEEAWAFTGEVRQWALSYSPGLTHGQHPSAGEYHPADGLLHGTVASTVWFISYRAGFHCILLYILTVLVMPQDY